jgi:hypothetical protein
VGISNLDENRDGNDSKMMFNVIIDIILNWRKNLRYFTKFLKNKIIYFLSVAKDFVGFESASQLVDRITEERDGLKNSNNLLDFAGEKRKGENILESKIESPDFDKSVMRGVFLSFAYIDEYSSHLGIEGDNFYDICKAHNFDNGILKFDIDPSNILLDEFKGKAFKDMTHEIHNRPWYIMLVDKKSSGETNSDIEIVDYFLDILKITTDLIHCVKEYETFLDENKHKDDLFGSVQCMSTKFKYSKLQEQILNEARDISKIIKDHFDAERQLFDWMRNKIILMRRKASHIFQSGFQTITEQLLLGIQSTADLLVSVKYSLISQKSSKKHQED